MQKQKKTIKKLLADVQEKEIWMFRVKLSSCVFNIYEKRKKKFFQKFV